MTGLVAQYKQEKRTRELKENIAKVQKALEEAIEARDAAEKAFNDFRQKKVQDALQAQDLAAKKAEDYPMSNGTIAHIQAPVLPQMRVVFFDQLPSLDEQFLERKRLETMAKVAELEQALEKLNFLLRCELDKTD